jgi:hypothetical protein
MSSSLTVELNNEVLALADREARSRNTTLDEVVRQQLTIMAENWQDSHAGKTPITDSLRGAIRLPGDFDSEKFLADELQKKHGYGG